MRVPRFPIALVLFVSPVMIGCDYEPASPEVDRILSEDAAYGAADGNGRGPVVEFADLAIFLEANSTDGDLGVQVFLDAEAWDRIQARSPSREPVLDFKVMGELGELGLTELRWESDEPSPAEVLALVPAGTYHFTGRTVDGGRLLGSAVLSHLLPPAPVFVHPLEDGEVGAEDLVLEWTIAGVVEAFEVIVENEDTGATLEVRLPGDVRTLRVPEEFLGEGGEFKAEVISILGNGNKTITEIVFAVDG